VSILARGQILFRGIKPLISAGGGVQSVQRVIEVSRMAILMEKKGDYHGEWFGQWNKDVSWNMRRL